MLGTLPRLTTLTTASRKLHGNPASAQGLPRPGSLTQNPIKATWLGLQPQHGEKCHGLVLFSELAEPFRGWDFLECSFQDSF